ncbi:hypothetical protein RI845_16790 [Thalassotalea nanhaiensis]|uniref:Uncharacterized protein n=1 Tax=Thalassotalea nanhaiensis TaxID=3065648 RepID=A0ABY9THG0_9GAMM|nr:hypothetical protein RI845_16790 [Colwelliaceae bacterium SQ345]
METELTDLAQALTQSEKQKRIELIKEVINDSSALFNNLNDHIDISHFQKLFAIVNSTISDDNLLSQSITKSFWVLELLLAANTNQPNYHGKLLFEYMDIFDISPKESLSLSWSTIFAITAIDRLCELCASFDNEVNLEKALAHQAKQSAERLHLDAIDCGSKAMVFTKLIDENWASSYLSKLQTAKRVAKTDKLKGIVLIRYIREHTDVDVTSAANAIESQLVSENCPELSSLRSEARRAKTFAEWINKHKEGELKIPIF